MKKELVIKEIIAALSAELAVYMKSARAAHAAATDEQSKAENKYDTRGLEASYLARGQAQQAAEIAEAIREFDAMKAKAFSSEDAIEVGALVELEKRTERMVVFLAPRGGGTDVVCDGREVLVITPQSPMGRQLAGRRQGDFVEVRVGGLAETYRVASVN